jgi:hypothetical protein
MRRFVIQLSVLVVAISIIGVNLWLATQALIRNISTAIAQTEWKTYLNPVYKFSFDLKMKPTT